MLKKLATIALLGGASLLVSADTYVKGVRTTITTVDSYSHGVVEGDIRILVSESVPGCEAGYYLTATNNGVDKTLSIALSAFHANTNVIIGGRSGIPWSGSGNSSYCKIHAISLVK